MMSDSFLNLLSDVGKLVRDSDKPFGGLQVIFAGDFFQLPPVVTDNSNQTGDRSFAFTSRSWKEALPAERCHFLYHAHRQKDPAFAAMLDRIRFGERTRKDCSTLAAKSVTTTARDAPNTKAAVNPLEEPTFLSAVNKDVSDHNTACIEALRQTKGEAHTFLAVDGDLGASEKVANSTVLRPDFIRTAVQKMHE